jgi:hypothetical protein
MTAAHACHSLSRTGARVTDGDRGQGSPNRVHTVIPAHLGDAGHPVRKQTTMTKNRARKHAIRATKAQSGDNYTSALRAHDTTGNVFVDPSAPLMRAPAFAIYGQPGSGMARLWQHNLPLGWDADDQLVRLPIGNDLPPITFLTGATGGGKTVTSLQLAKEFLDLHPQGRVLWLDPMLGSSSDFFYTHLDPARATFITDTTDGVGLWGSQATGERFTQPLADLLDNPPQGPILLVVEELEYMLDNPYNEPKPWQPRMRELLTRVASEGRSRAIHALYSGQRPLDPAWAGHAIVNAVANTLWVGPVHDRSRWEGTFGHVWDQNALNEAADALRRYPFTTATRACLLTTHDTAPRLLELPPHPNTAGRDH